MSNFKNNFLDIVTDTTGKYVDNGAAALLVELVRECSGDDSDSFAKMAEEFSNDPTYGRNGEAGGVNVDHQTGVSYVNSSDSIWMTLDALVDAALDGGGTPDWWDPDWTTGQTDDEIAVELAAEAAEASCVRERFQSFGTGSPIVNIEYSYDENFVYEKCGRVTTKAEITPEQFTELNSLHFGDSIRAAHVFSEASGGASSAPI